MIELLFSVGKIWITKYPPRFTIITVKLIHNLIDCPDLFCQIHFLMLRQNNHQHITFYTNTAETNILKVSPTFQMSPIFNEMVNYI